MRYYECEYCGRVIQTEEDIKHSIERYESYSGAAKAVKCCICWQAVCEFCIDKNNCCRDCREVRK